VRRPHGRRFDRAGFRKASSRCNVVKYGPDGGTPLATWHGADPILNNPAGVWVGSDAEVFNGQDRPGIAFCPVAPK